LKLSRDELYAFINGGELPPTLAEAIRNDDAPEAEPIYSRRGKQRHTEPDAETPGGDTDTTPNFESEGIKNEE
jgi:hypothetical protein